MQTGVIDYIILGIAMAGILAYIIMYKYSFHVYFTKTLAQAAAYLLAATTLFCAGNFEFIPRSLDVIMRILAIPLLILAAKKLYQNTNPYYIAAETETATNPRRLAGQAFKMKPANKDKTKWIIDETSIIACNYFSNVKDAAGCLSTIIFLEYGNSDRYKWFDETCPEDIFMEWQPLSWYKAPGLYELATHKLIYKANDTEAIIDGTRYHIKSQYHESN